MIPDHIQFDSSYSISLIYGDITVQLGKDADLEEKMNRVIAILPKIREKKVFFIWRVWLRSPIPLKKNWNRKKLLLRTGNGGYDEDGNYTGDGEYDEDGNYVGAKTEDCS